MKKRLLSTILALCMIMTIIPIMPIVSSAAEKPAETRSAAVRAASEGTICGDLLILDGGDYGTYFTYDAVLDMSSIEVYPGTDMNNDGKINCHDVIMMKKYTANMSNQ